MRGWRLGVGEGGSYGGGCCDEGKYSFLCLGFVVLGLGEVVVVLGKWFGLTWNRIGKKQIGKRPERVMRRSRE